MKNNKILITSPKSAIGGVSSFVNSILPFFKEDVSVFYRGKAHRGECRVMRLINSVLLPIKFIIQLLCFNPKFVIINTSLSKSLLIRDGLLVMISKLFSKRVLLIIHGFEDKVLSCNVLLKYGYFKSNAIIVLAEDFKNKIIKAGYKRNVYTQYNPVDPNLILKNETNKDAELQKDILNILFLSRIEKDKGIYIALDAFSIIQKKYPNFKFSIAGNGSEYKNVKQYIEDHKLFNVVLENFVQGEDKVKMLLNNNIFLFPTFHKEGLPINVLEAMAFGQIIITRPVGGLVDLYKNIKFGILEDSVNPEIFAKDLEFLLLNSEVTHKMRIDNMSFAKTHFHPQVIVDKIESILNSL